MACGNDGPAARLIQFSVIVPIDRMRFARIILLVLLALNLPGWAFAAMPGCSSEQGAMAQAAMTHAAMDMASMDHGSMQHAATNADGQAMHCCAGDQSNGDQPAGTACHDGAHCQCGGLYQAAQPLSAIVVPALPGIDQTALFPVITASALPHWRPPTSA